jgi:hypothetical protein
MCKIVSRKQNMQLKLQRSELLCLFCLTVVVNFCMTTDIICLRVSLIHACVESAYVVEEGTPGQHMWHP